MPLGWERINAQKSSPNKNIVFIKPRLGPDESISKEFLERLAAQCVPIMNKHHLAIVSLEEYEPQLEFWGRNFNNGEVIQLVLKSPSTGNWLPFRFVQMVLMHELAHCKEMNHSKAFWALRNQFASEIKLLWAKGFTGEGLWGRGVLLSNDKFLREKLDEGEALPEYMCGGTFRSRASKKRKIKPKITYREKKERAIKKKFGTNGKVLGADQEAKSQLETKKTRLGKPKVAASQRGRELRAAAAMARFEEKIKETDIKDEFLVTDSEYESDKNKEPYPNSEENDAKDINGRRILDRKGQGMINVCADEVCDGRDLKQELLEVISLSYSDSDLSSNKSSHLPLLTSNLSAEKKSFMKDKDTKEFHSKATIFFSFNTPEKRKDILDIRTDSLALDNVVCPACSFINGATSMTCSICSNILKPDFDPKSWMCERSSCKDKPYRNANDVVFCGICAARRHSSH